MFPVLRTGFSLYHVVFRVCPAYWITGSALILMSSVTLTWRCVLFCVSTRRKQGILQRENPGCLIDTSPSPINNSAVVYCQINLFQWSKFQRRHLSNLLSLSTKAPSVKRVTVLCRIRFPFFKDFQNFGAQPFSWRVSELNSGMYSFLKPNKF